MTTRRRKKGEVEWVDLGEFSKDLKGLEVGLRHEGPGVLRDWHLRMQAVRLEELRRAVKAREGLTPDTAPEFFDKLRDDHGNVRVQTPEGVRALLALAVEVVAEVLTGARGETEVLVEGVPLSSEMARLGVIEGLMQRAMEVQSLTVAERFPAEGSGDAG